MPLAIPVNERVTLLTANDRRTHLFESLWPIPQGVSYNAYVVRAGRTALIDTMERGYVDAYLERVQEIIGPDGQVDYLVINHMEPDHSAGIRAVTRRWPNVKLIGNKMTFNMLKAFYGISDGLQTVSDGDVIDLDGASLQFFTAPWLHWPETMVTWLPEANMLFSGDAFGSFGAHEGGVFDDEIDIDRTEPEMLRYYANIVGKFSKHVTRAIDKLSVLPVQTIGATHGPVWRVHPEVVVERYRKWAAHEADPGVVIAYGSMYGYTAHLADVIARALYDRGVRTVRIHDVSVSDLSEIVRDIWRYSTVILGSSAYNGGMFPGMAALTDRLEALELTNRTLALFGSSGWNRSGVKSLSAFAERIGWTLAGPLAETGAEPSADTLTRCRAIAEAITA